MKNKIVSLLVDLDVWLEWNVWIPIIVRSEMSMEYIACLFPAGKRWVAKRVQKRADDFKKAFEGIYNDNA